MLCGFSDLILFFLTISLATHRSTAKLLSVLTQTFTELALKVRTIGMEYHTQTFHIFLGLLGFFFPPILTAFINIAQSR